MNSSELAKPPPIRGLRHVALFVKAFEACEEFYRWLGFVEEWRPDADNLYLSSGLDNLALHRVKEAATLANQRLDHIGLILAEPGDVDLWYEFLTGQAVRMRNAPKTHRDGARSFYCFDPDGTLVQLIYHPPIARAV